MNRFGQPQSPDQAKVIRTFQTVIKDGKAEGASRSDVLAAKLADAKLQTKVEHKIDKCQRFKQVRGGFMLWRMEKTVTKSCFVSRRWLDGSYYPWKKHAKPTKPNFCKKSIALEDLGE